MSRIGFGGQLIRWLEKVVKNVEQSIDRREKTSGKESQSHDTKNDDSWFIRPPKHESKSPLIRQMMFYTAQANSLFKSESRKSRFSLTSGKGGSARGRLRGRTPRGRAHAIFCNSQPRHRPILRAEKPRVRQSSASALERHTHRFD